MEKAFKAVVHAVSGIAGYFVVVGTGVAKSGLDCLQQAYAQVGAALPGASTLADSLSAEAAKQGATEPSFLVVASLLGGASWLIGWVASKVPVWTK